MKKGCKKGETIELRLQGKTIMKYNGKYCHGLKFGQEDKKFLNSGC